MTTVLEWWEVENTGWSNGQSWFPISKCRDNRRFDSEADATQIVADNRWDDPQVEWRTVHVTLERSENQTVTTRTWTEV